MGPVCREIDISDFSQCSQYGWSRKSPASSDNVIQQVYEVAAANVSSECLVIVIRLSKVRAGRPDICCNALQVFATAMRVAKRRVAAGRDGSDIRAAKLIEHVIAQHCQRPGKDAVDVFHYSKQSWLA
jgi:hypothetical protein